MSVSYWSSTLTHASTCAPVHPFHQNLDIHHARYRVALAILKLSEKELTKKKNGMGELMMYLKNLPDAILVPDVLMPAALGIKLKVSLRLRERACMSVVAYACVCPCVCVRACFRCPGAAQGRGHQA